MSMLGRLLAAAQMRLANPASTGAVDRRHKWPPKTNNFDSKHRRNESARNLMNSPWILSWKPWKSP